MSDNHNSGSSTSDSEVDVYNINFNPLKALYSSKTKIPVTKAPIYETLSQFENAQAGRSIIQVGQRNLAAKIQQERKEAKEKTEKELQEKNKQRFSKFQGLVPRKPFRAKNVLTRIEKTIGPLAALKDCVDRRIRVRIITRNATGVRGELQANLVAFDKQWNMALTDVQEEWTRKRVKKRKVPPSIGEAVPQGTASKVSPVPKVIEIPLGKGLWKCFRHIPQLMMRGEHVVLVNIVNRQ